MTGTVENFFTWSSLGTLAGASAAVVVVSNTIRKVSGLCSPVVPLVVALMVTFGAAWNARTLLVVADWGLAFLNACLLFCTATGAQEVIVEAATSRPAGGPRRYGRRKLKWFSSWFRD